MSETDANKYSNHSTEQLENLLKQSSLPADEQQLVQEELTKRITADLLKPPPPHEHTEQLTQPKPQPKPQQGGGCIWVVILIVIGVVLVAILSSVNRPRSHYCVTPYGTCGPGPANAPGSACWCGTTPGYVVVY